MPEIFLYKQQFLLQLLVGEGIFLLRLERKPGFRYLAPLSITVLFCITFLLPANNLGPISAAGQYLFMFLCTLAAIRLCFQEPFQNLLFCGIAGYTIQHLSYLLFTIVDRYVFYGIGYLGVPVVDPYSPSDISFSGFNPLQTALYFGIYIVDYLVIFFLVYLITFDLLDPLIRSNHNLRFGHANYIFLSGLLIVADVIFNMITLFYTAENTVSNALEVSYNIFLCLLILALLYHQLSKQALKDELSGVRYVLEQGKRQYEQAQKTSELINIKYHDLRHLSVRLEKRGSLFPGEQEELEQILSNYDVQVRTGNEVLDTILTEKNLLCQKEAIQLICMADGSKLDFIKPHHLYSLLSNAFDNAIEAVRSLPESERFIHLYISCQGNLYHIQIVNPYQGSVALRKGIPLTHKEDQNYHGFGVLSMKTIAESYNGELIITAEDGFFSLDVLLTSPG